VPKFDGDSLGGDLAYDFTGYGHPEIVGVVPEPSRFAAKKFFKNIQLVMKSLDLVKDEDKDKDTASPEQIVEAMNAVDDEEMFDRLTDGVTDCLAELCGNTYRETPEGKEWNNDGKPTHSQLTALGYRPFMGFFGYLMQNLMNPELQAPATKTSPVRLRSV
jgi:hypothetical protein